MRKSNRVCKYTVAGTGVDAVTEGIKEWERGKRRVVKFNRVRESDACPHNASVLKCRNVSGLDG
jgi:hypothetical protein